MFNKDTVVTISQTFVASFLFLDEEILLAASKGTHLVLCVPKYIFVLVCSYRAFAASVFA